MAQLEQTVLYVTPEEQRQLLAARNTRASRASQAFVLGQVVGKLVGRRVAPRLVLHLDMVVDPVAAQRLLAA